jgi:hypothetical protein
MKTYLLVITFLFTICSEAQNYIPHAGEVSKVKISKDADIQSIRSNALKPMKTLDVINFDSSNVSFKGNYPFSLSYSLGMSPDGDLVFVGSGGGIYITDVSNPISSGILSEVRTRSLIDACTYDPVNKRLYVCAYFSGIEIWDLSDLYNPVRMCRIPTEPYPRSGVAYSGNYLFFTTNYTIWSYDISDPYHPALASQLYLGNSLISELYMKGNIIYITSSSQGLKLIDVSDPLNLQLIHAYSYIVGYKFDISGDYLYAVKTTGELTILNISDSLNVNVVSSINLSGYPFEVAVFNNTAYVAKGGTDGGLHVVDVSDPATPVPISLYSGDYQFIKGSGNYVYLTRNSIFSILDVTDPSSVQYVSGYAIPGFVEDVAVSGNYAYTGSNGFRVIDISDSTHPVQKGYADVTGDLVETAGSSLVVYCPYSMTANNTVHIMDVSNPHYPVSMSSYTCPAMTWDLKVRDTLAYIACWWDGVRIFNFADPSNLTQISHVMGWTQGGIAGVDWCYAQSLDIEGNYLYIVDYGPFPTDDTYGLYIIDISDPSNPFLLNRFTGITSHASDMAVKDGVVYIADGNGGVEAVDVTDPMNPSVLGYLSLPDGATGIKTDGKYAYVSDYILGGIQVIDITDPTALLIAGYYKPSGCFALNVDYNNGYIYIADGLAGIQIYRNSLITPVAVKQENAAINNFRLDQNYPNPFNPATKIKYSIPKSSNVVIKVFDVLGKEVTTLVNEYKPAGTYELTWNAASADGLPSGVYFYQLRAGNFIQTKKMLLLK